MNINSLNKLPFTLTTKFCLENINSQRYYKISVSTIKKAIERPISLNKDCNINEIIGYLHFIINRERGLFYMENSNINFLLICIRKDLTELCEENAEIEAPID